MDERFNLLDNFFVFVIAHSVKEKKIEFPSLGPKIFPCRTAKLKNLASTKWSKKFKSDGKTACKICHKTDPPATISSRFFMNFRIGEFQKNKKIKS